MSVPTNILFNDFFKAVPILAAKQGFVCKVFRGTGSAIRFELFKHEGDTKPFNFWVVHEDKKEKKIYSKDLKKACNALSVSKKDFESLIRNKFKTNKA